MGFSTVGAVSIDERGITTVQSRVNGYIEKLYVRAQYDAVSQGQKLLEIYAPDWLSAQEEYLALKRSSQPGADLLAEAARERLKLLGISEEQIQAIERDGKTNPRITLHAPEAGLVWELGAREGMAVSPGVTLFKLAPVGTVWVNAEVPETQAELIRPGVEVEGRAAAFPDKVFKGKVAALLPDVNATTRTIKARIVLANPGGLLKPGMFARLDFGGHQKQGLMVPTEAVIYTGKRNVVIVADGEGKFRPVDVEMGRDSGEMSEIRKGLEAGQRVVVSGQFLIDSEASLKTTVERMNAPEPPPATRGRQP
jgi:Cu(I)/Ag(I) efflux system membrane fusion protein